MLSQRQADKGQASITTPYKEPDKGRKPTGEIVKLMDELIRDEGCKIVMNQPQHRFTKPSNKMMDCNDIYYI